MSIEKQIWDAACILRSHVSATEYRKVLTELIYLRQNCSIEKWTSIQDSYKEGKLKLCINEELVKLLSDNDKTLIAPISNNIDDAELYKILEVFSQIDNSEDNLFGTIYEYCLKEFAHYEGKNGGEFYTPSIIIKLILDLFSIKNGDSIYDPCCGCGGVFVEANKRAKIKGYAQECNPDTWKLAQFNMKINNCTLDIGNKAEDTFKKDLHPNILVDYIISNPPFNQTHWNKEGNEHLWLYGEPPAKNANYGWIQLMLSHLKDNGKIALLLTNSSLTESSHTKAETEIRKNLIEAGLVESIITFPRNMFYSTDIPFCIWILSKQKNDKVLLIDASQKTEQNFQEIIDAYYLFKNNTIVDINNFAKTVTIKELHAKNYLLFPAHYIYKQYSNENCDNLYTLGELAKWKYGNINKKSYSQDGNYPIYTSAGIIGYSETAYHAGPSIIIGRKGNINSVFFEKGKFSCTDVVYYTSQISNEILPEYLYYKLKAIDFIVYDDSCGVPSLKRNILENIQINVPDKVTQESYLQQIKILENEKQRLTKKVEAIEQEIEHYIQKLK